MTTSVLDAIVAGARRSALDRSGVLRDAVEREAMTATPDARAFMAALSAPGVRVIAECKRRSPSRGVLRRDYDAAAIAAAVAVAAEGTAPEDDPQASAWYRREVLPVHLRRLLSGETR